MPDYYCSTRTVLYSTARPAWPLAGSSSITDNCRQIFREAEREEWTKQRTQTRSGGADAVQHVRNHLLLGLANGSIVVGDNVH
jgi:hypothetical protein